MRISRQNLVKHLTRLSSNNPANMGASLPVRHQVSHCSDGATNEPAKATVHVVANMQVQRRSHARTACRFMAGGTSPALVNANCLIMSTASLHRPPVSMATKCGGTSQELWECAKTTLALRPEWDRRCARFAADWPDSMVFFLKVESEAEDANAASRAATRRFLRMIRGRVACSCAVLASLVLQQPPPDPTGTWPDPIQRDTPSGETHCGRFLGYAPQSLGKRRLMKPNTLHVNIDLCNLNPNLPSAGEALPTLVHAPVQFHFLGMSPRSEVAVFQIPSS